MSLDKFITRGFTSSTGGGLHNWVAKTSQSYTQNTVKEKDGSGTSFVMGGGGISRSGSNKTKDALNSSLKKEIRTQGTRGQGPMRKQCFGGAAGGADTEHWLSGRWIPAAFVILTFLGVSYILIHSMGLIPSTTVRDHRVTTDADVFRRRQPQW